MMKDSIVTTCIVGLAMLSFACSDTTKADRTVVGEELDGAFVVTMNTDSIEAAWEAQSQNEGKPVDYSTFQIQESKYEDTGGSYYLLISKVWDGETKTETGTPLELVDGKFYFPEETGL